MSDLRYTLGIDGAAAGRTLAGLQGGIGGLHGALVGLGAVGLFTKIIKDGLAFNQTMHDGELTIAAIVEQFQGLNEVAAKEVAAGAMKKIIDLEPKVAGSLADLVNGFASTAAASASVGISVDQNIDLVGRFANGLAKLTQPIEQVGQELRSVLSGSISADSDLAKTLGITNEMVAAAKDAGQLYEMLDSKIGKMGDAGDNAATRFSSLGSAIDKAKGALASGLFDQTLDGSVALTDALNENVESFEAIGRGLASITTKAVESTKVIADWGRAIGITVGVYADMLTNGVSYADAMANAEDALTDSINERSKAETDAANAAPSGKPSAAGTYAGGEGDGKGKKKRDTLQDGIQARDANAARNQLLGAADVLEAQAAGHDKLAKAMQRELEIEKNKLEYMKVGLMSADQALAKAQRVADLEDKLARRRARKDDDGSGPGAHIRGVSGKRLMGSESGSMSKGGPLTKGGGLDGFNRMQEKDWEPDKKVRPPIGYGRNRSLPLHFDSLSTRRGAGEDIPSSARKAPATPYKGQGLTWSLDGYAAARVGAVTKPVQGNAKNGASTQDPNTALLAATVAELKRIRTA